MKCLLSGWILDLARSPILSKMVEMDLLAQQDKEGTIVLTDLGAKAFEFLLKFIYTGSLECVVGLDCDSVKEILDACTKVRIVKLSFAINLNAVFLYFTLNCVCTFSTSSPY
jgi:hypothetical protein